MTVERTDIPPRRERPVWDAALSVVLMIVSLGAYLIGAVLALLGVALFGGCNGGVCTGSTIPTAAIVLLILLVAGITATIVAIRLRFRAWWIAAITFITMLVGWFLSYVLAAFGV